jgi:hypothetical protein
MESCADGTKIFRDINEEEEAIQHYAVCDHVITVTHRCKGAT